MSLIIILRKKETSLCTGPRKTFMKIIVFYVKIYNNEKKAKIYRIFLKSAVWQKTKEKKNSIDKITQLKKFLRFSKHAKHHVHVFCKILIKEIYRITDEVISQPCKN